MQVFLGKELNQFYMEFVRLGIVVLEARILRLDVVVASTYPNMGVCNQYG